jgi:hypothetical protein
MGRQPFGLASPAAWLRRAGAEVRCFDLSVEPGRAPGHDLHPGDLLCFYLPMHTATRLSVPLIRSIRKTNPQVHICCFGLYAGVNERFLREIGADTVVAGEFEPALLALYQQLCEGVDSTLVADTVSLQRLDFVVPERGDLPALSNYARFRLAGGEERTVGYTEASRGCRHRCRHCPVVPVYDGRFFVVQRQIVLADIDQLVAAGAQHITFGDPDFFNGIGHSMRIVTEMNKRHPHVSYDITVKVEHLLRHERELPRLQGTGCRVVTSAVESIDDALLRRLDKGHTCQDFVRAVEVLRLNDLVMNPTFIPFNPWTTVTGYLDLLAALVNLDLVDQVAPIQLGIRLLVPSGSRLLTGNREWLGAFDPESLSFPWTHPDGRMDRLQKEVVGIIDAANQTGLSRRECFAQIWEAGHREGDADQDVPCITWRRPAVTVPFLTEPWYC